MSRKNQPRDAARGIEEPHVVHQWRHLGTARDESELEALASSRRLPEFDPDILKLLRRWLEEHPGRAAVNRPSLTRVNTARAGGGHAGLGELGAAT